MIRSLAVLLLLTGCLSVDPALKQKTDDTIVHYKQATPRSVPAANAQAVPDWAPGQYVVFLTTSKGEPSLVRVSVESRDDQGIWVESQSLGYRGKSTVKVLYRQQPHSQEEAKAAVRKIITQTADGSPSTVDFEDPANANAAIIKDAMASAWDSLFFNVQKGASPQTVTTPAGTFDGSLPYHTVATVVGTKWEYDGFVHYGVPISGSVKAQSADGNSTIELLDFGTDGSTQKLF